MQEERIKDLEEEKKRIMDEMKEAELNYIKETNAINTIKRAWKKFQLKK